MAIVVRADASFAMGSGHVMRCLTLADALKSLGHSIHFICKAHDGNLVDYIQTRGFGVTILPCEDASDGDLAHAHWLGGSWQSDAKLTLDIIHKLPSGCTWVVVDHYGLDYRWQEAIKEASVNVLVIDDLADRRHTCEVLLDQTYGQSDDRYSHLVPKHCRTLLGAKYALLREQFSRVRPRALARRKSIRRISTVLISMGGADPDNLTKAVIDIMQPLYQDHGIRLVVLMGQNARHREAIQALAVEGLEVRVAVEDMASLMAQVDVAIGTAGTTSWERCCTALPTIMIISAENQRLIAQGLADRGAAILGGEGHRVDPEVLRDAVLTLSENTDVYQSAVDAAATVCDGRGVQYLVEAMCLKAA